MQFNYKDQIDKIKIKVLSMSKREQLLLAGAILITLLMLINKGIEQFQYFNQSQIQRLKYAENSIKALPYALERHARLKKRQEQAKLAYKDVEISEGALAHIEKLVKEVAGVSDFQIKDKAAVKFGSQYEQQPFQVSFNTTDTKKLIEFLNEIENGKKPLILGNLSLVKMNGINPRIKVDLIASTIIKIQNN